MNIAVASGKGGTGKTSVAVSLALSIGADVFLDCDVEGPNAHIFLSAQIEDSEDIFMYKPQFDLDKCSLCGKCAKACNFGAIVVSKKKLFFFPELCHGCGLCSYVCEFEAISENKFSIGRVECGTAGDMSFCRGLLFSGESLSPLVVQGIKEHISEEKINILDSPAGNACPMRETVRGSDFCILVTEPTPFGLHDLKIALGAVRSMGIPCAVVINKDRPGFSGVDTFCRENGVDILMRIPFDVGLAKAYSEGIPISVKDESFKEKFIHLFHAIKEKVKAGAQ